MKGERIAMALILVVLSGLMYASFLLGDFYIGIKNYRVVEAKDAEIASLTRALAEKTANATQTAEATESQKLLTVEGSYNVTITDDEDFIRAGKYDWVSPGIVPQNFSIKECPRGDIQLLLVKIKKPMLSDEIVKEMDKEGLRPGNLLELCALDTKYPELSRKHVIVAYGSSVVLDRRYMPIIHNHSPWGRCLDLGYWSGVRRLSSHFLAVRK